MARVVTVGYPAIVHSLGVLAEHAGRPMTVIRNSVVLHPGAVWGHDNVLLAADNKTVQYARGETVYEDDPLSYLASAYDASIKLPVWIANVAPVQARPLFGMARSLSPWWGQRGSVCGWLNQFGTFYVSHRPQLELATRQAGLFLDGLFGLKPLWTTLFFSLAASMGTGGPEVFERWVKPGDAGPFLGILLGSSGAGRISLDGFNKALGALRESPTEDFASCVSVPIFSLMVRRAGMAAESLAPLVETLRARM